ncbi:chemotaxis protein CheA [Brachyspira hyodysenteriae]|uniref:Chemotaxis protein CheA n=1 Tax=Brachyspira hyodysenteriae (strain ATCC 49526 / WA1) TaxID=565034 RepID=A0A3B6V8L2_BRAHW|nr:chemotaxis protein CheA [Brachyspira hyodysenteriae]ACN82985.1 chemotaxis histidine kinase CheA [Brachyspira hyodysenteriae WA1]AUJ48732.1 chemotaxis protein CheA [Brachyspira hyodysenteriae]KLI16343.1 chemotaxis protein CheA [Brachyspira hyodysenteriae]KLI16987.1 chemotaxis protein CheA [Brachyspira hyodysenteriae]KLI18738.1 chemotaxis protein CheA [Brachyspira hyodysenteriae]
MFDSDEFISIFLSEANEIVEGLENDLVLLEDNKSDEDLLNKIFRSAHTLKSSAGTVGFTIMSELNHVAENLLEKVRSGKLDVTPQMITVLLEFLDTVKLMLQNIVDGKSETEGVTNIDSLKAKIKAIADGNDVSTAAATPKASPEPKKEEPAKEEAKTEEKKEDTKTESPASSGGENSFHIEMGFKATIFDNGIDPLMFLNDLRAIGTISNLRIECNSLPTILNLEDPYVCYTQFSLDFETNAPEEQVQNIFLFVIDDNDINIINTKADIKDDEEANKPAESKKEEPAKEEAKENTAAKTEEKPAETSAAASKPAAAPKAGTKVQAPSTVRVDTRKLDSLMNLIGELVIAQSRIMQLTQSLDIDNGLKEAVSSMDRTSRQIQEEVMNIRMMPIGPIFTQFHRYVRDLNLELNKEVKLVLKGETTEIDKNMLEQLSDPLKHIIRNSMDHGIEKTKEERIARGKPEYGTITMSAAHQEGHVVIEVSDDGNGLNKEKIFNKAVEKGLLSRDGKYSDIEIYRTIFSPGLSTAEKITDISGRGVGMDVVRANVEKMKGKIEIKSTEGQGSTFIIKLPLTLAIIEGITFALGKQIYIMPLISIIEQIKVKNEQVKPFEGKGEMIKIRDEYLPLIRLHKVFEIDTQVDNIDDGIVVVVEAGYRKCAIFVDELLDQQQVVIKSLDSAFSKHAGIAGGTILGDGRIALIIDIQGLVNMSLQGKINNGVK